MPATQVVSLLLSASIATGLAACGGGSQRPQGGGGTGSSETGLAEAGAETPTDDRIAYYQLATAVGQLRAGSIAVARGEASPAASDPSRIQAAADRVAAVHPSDPTLTRIERSLLPLLRRGASQQTASGARDIVAELRGVRSALDRYARDNPDVAAFTSPD